MLVLDDDDLGDEYGLYGGDKGSSAFALKLGPLPKMMLVLII